MNHLETLVRQFYEWQGYIVRGNVRVGRLPRGGWEGELDVVAYHPISKHLIHLEPSINASSWATREKIFTKKFNNGKKYIYKSVFPWLDNKTPLEQVAILFNAGQSTVGGGDVESIDAFVDRIKEKIQGEGRVGANAIPEEFGLLRTIQMVICGYGRPPTRAHK